MHLSIELALKDVSDVVGSIGQICAGITCFALDFKHKSAEPAVQRTQACKLRSRKLTLLC